jgi:hypothetical protein
MSWASHFLNELFSHSWCALSVERNEPPQQKSSRTLFSLFFSVIMFRILLYIQVAFTGNGRRWNKLARWEIPAAYTKNKSCPFPSRLWFPPIFLNVIWSYRTVVQLFPHQNKVDSVISSVYTLDCVSSGCISRGMPRGMRSKSIRNRKYARC